MGFSFRRGFRGLFGRARRLSGKTRCSVCLKYYKSANLKTPRCSHSYCRVCLRRTFSRLITEPECVVPPRCCGFEITLASAGDFLDGVENSADKVGLKEQYVRVLEKRTVDPVFCSRGCMKDLKDLEEGEEEGVQRAMFILPEDIKEEEDLAVCRKCGLGTCTLCRKPAPHKKGGKEGGCDVGEEEREEIRYKRLSGRSGWRCCEACGMMVSRDVGCAHVVCRCGNDVWLAF